MLHSKAGCVRNGQNLFYSRVFVSLFDDTQCSLRVVCSRYVAENESVIGKWQIGESPLLPFCILNAIDLLQASRRKWCAQNKYCRFRSVFGNYSMSCKIDSRGWDDATFYRVALDMKCAHNCRLLEEENRMCVASNRSTCLETRTRMHVGVGIDRPHTSSWPLACEKQIVRECFNWFEWTGLLHDVELGQW